MWSLGLPRHGSLVSDADQEKNGGLIRHGRAFSEQRPELRQQSRGVSEHVLHVRAPCTHL